MICVQVLPIEIDGLKQGAIYVAIRLFVVVLMALVTAPNTEKAKAVVAFATIRTNVVRAGPSTTLRFAQDDGILWEGNEKAPVLLRLFRLSREPALSEVEGASPPLLRLASLTQDRLGLGLFLAATAGAVFSLKNHLLHYQR